MDRDASFGSWLMQRRKALGLTRSQLANQAGCAAVTLRKIEEDARRPSPELAVQLARHLQIAADAQTLFIAVARGERGVDWLPSPDLPAHAPSHASSGTPRADLPIPVTSLVGRQHERAAVCTMLQQEEVRLLVLTGPGGVGKTRLALAAAHSLQDHFSDGVVFVTLASISDPALVVSNIADALGLCENASRTLRDLVREYVRSRHMLLVLDNFEHVLDAASLIAELLSVAPRLKLLVTSRVVLHLSGEYTFSVPPLAIHDSSERPSADASAVLLFIERARAAGADISLNVDEISIVTQICRRLDGLPLAIELTAAWVRLLPPTTILAHLQSVKTATSLPLLAGGPRDRPTHQHTLHATIAWSYNLLSDRDQGIFRRLAVFVGGCTLEAAGALLDSTPDEIADHGVARSTSPRLLTDLATLVDASLLRQIGDAGEPRFSMLETIREYALDRLAEHSEAYLAQRRHATYYLDLVESAFHGSDHGLTWLSRVETEHNNLRAALMWAIEQRDAEIAERIAQRMEWFWFSRGHISEGRVWLERTIAISRNSKYSAILHRMAGYFAFFQGDYPQARILFEISLACFQQLGDLGSSADLRINLAMVAEALGDIDQAQALVEESLVTRHALEGGEPIADALYHRGRLRLLQGDTARAQRDLEESLVLFRAVERVGMIPIVLGILGYTLLQQGSQQVAEPLFREAIAMLSAQGNTFILPYSLIGLAGVLSEQHPERAAQLLGAADGLVVQSGLRPSPGERAIWNQIIGDVHAQLEPARYQAAYAIGSSMTQEEQIATVLTG